MAPRRINAKLLIIVGVCLCLAGAAAGAMWFLTRTNVAATLREAEAAEQAGDRALAIELYAKVAKHPRFQRDSTVIMRIADLHRTMPVETQRLAQYHLKHWFAWLRQAWRVNPDTGPGSAFQQEMDALLRLGFEVRRTASWDEMFQRTDEILSQYPHMTAALKYRGVSQVNRMMLAASNLTAEERTQAEVDLQRALNEFPDDRHLVLHLARWHALEAEAQDRARADRTRVERLRDQAAAFTDEAVQRHPDDVDRRIDHVSVLMSLNRIEEIGPHIEMLAVQLAARPGTPLAATNVVQLLLRHQALTDGTGDARPPKALLGRAIDIVESAQKAHPDSPLLMVVLARLRQLEGEKKRAVVQYEYAWKVDSGETPLDFVMRFNARARAKLGSLSLRLEEATAMQKGTSREDALDQIAGELADVRAKIGDVPGIRRLAGTLAFARGDMGRTTRELDDYIRETGAQDAKTLLELAAAKRKQGDWGAAAAHYRDYLASWPDDRDVRAELVRVYLDGRMLDEAAGDVQWLLDHGDDAGAQALELELLLRRNDRQTARSRVRRLRLLDGTTGARLAEVARREGFAEEAEALAAKAHRIAPDDLKVLVVALGSTADREKQLAYIERSRAAGMPADALDQITRILGGEMNVPEAIDEQRRDKIAEESNPAIRAANEYRYWTQRGDLARARAALARVPDPQSLEPAFLEVAFDDALLRQAWDEAEDIAARARRTRDGQGADYAEGRFYLGRLNMARRRHDQAVTDFRAALERRSTYSDGWTWLAQALVEMRDLKAAQDAYTIAVRQKPDNVPALVGLAKVHADRGEPLVALDLFRRAHEFRPDDFTIADVCLIFEAEHGDIDRARTRREVILERDPENVANRKALSMVYARQGEVEEAMRQVRLMARYGATDRDRVIAEARVLVATDKQVEAATNLIRFARDSTDGSGEDHLAAARELVQMGFEADAISGYRRAAHRGGPNQVAAMRELAELLMRKGDESALAEARELYRKLWNMDRMNLRVGCAYARLLVLNQALDDAMKVKDTLLESHGRNVETLVLSAQVAAAREERAVAETSLDAAIKMAPLRADLHLGKAQLLSRDAIRHGDALSLLDHALELNPLLIDAQALKARIYDMRNEVTSAIAEYENLLRLEPDHGGRLRLADLYREHGYAPQLKALLDESVLRYPTSADWRRQQALFAQRQNNASLALKYMKESFRLLGENRAIPRRVAVLREVVRLMIQLEEAKDAVTILRGNTLLLRRDPVLQALRGRAVHMQNDDRATSYLRSALKDAAEKTKQNTENRRIFVETVMEVDAAVGLEQTRVLVEEIRSDTGSPVWVGLGLASLEFSAAEYEAVVRRLGRLEYKVYRLPPEEQASFYRMYGAALDETGQRDLASGAFDHLVRVDPDDPDARHRLAMILAESDREEDRAAAVERAQQAVALRPANPRFLDTLGWALFRTGRVAEAREKLEASLRTGATPLAHLHMAELELSAADGSRESAKSHLRNAVRHAERIEDSEVLVAAERRLEALGVRRAAADVMAIIVDAGLTDQRPRTLRDMADRLLRGAPLSVAILEESQQRWQNGRHDLETGFAYAGELIINEQYGEAQSVLQQLQSMHGDSVYTHVLATLIHAASQAYAQAELNIEAALRLAPRWAALHLARARLIAREASGFEGALVQLDEALKLDPTLAAAQQLKGDVYRLRGETNSAIREYESLLRLAPKTRRRLPLAELYFAAGRRVALKTLLEESETLFPRSSVWPHQQALLALHEGDGDLALRKMRIAFARGKTSPLLRDLVNLQLTAGRGDEAMAALQSNSDLALGDPIFQALQGRVLASRDEEEAGLRQYEAALRQVDDLPTFMMVTEQIRLGSGVEKAVALATTVFGASPSVWARLGIAAVEVKGEAYADALGRLDALAESVAAMDDPQRLHYERARALALHHEGRASEAEAAYGRWRSLAPADTAVYAGLGRLLAEELNRPEEAVGLLRDTWSTRPNDPALLDVLGLALWRVGENAEAKRVLEERLTRRPGAEAHLYLAEIALEEGRRVKAVEQLKSAKEMAERTQDARTLEAVDGLLSALQGDEGSNP